MKVIRETERPWIPLTEQKKVEYLIGKKLAGTTFRLKNSRPAADFQPAGERDGALVFHCSPDLEIQEKLTLYTTLNRHIEMDFKVVSRNEQGEILLKPVEARIGQSFRKSPRWIPGETVYVRNIQIVKDQEIQIERGRISYEIIFKEYMEKLADIYPGIRIYGSADQDRPEECRIVEKMSQMLYVVDTGRFEAYRSAGKGILDYYSILASGARAQTAVDNYKSRGVTSIACIPVLYKFPDGTSRTLATVLIEGKGESVIGDEHLARIDRAIQGLPERLINVNAFNLDKKQEVLNISENGAAILCDDELLLKYLPGIRNMTLDLVFSKQAPIRLQTTIRHIYQTDDRMIVGVQFEGAAHGHSAKGGMDRLKSLIQTLQKANT